ncbi:hypothetical protein NVIE_030240 [Nitrososphaera viennensis EN76]|uniref:Uncharacterized protein n=1 Tax=Nitrososphaera viennensis EN76 TaxID=926571 RepID=A0A060HV65_9ARCH|nr:hypothetical protein NVIE_030240 [Nitrososphaera viennensis EN76]
MLRNRDAIANSGNIQSSTNYMQINYVFREMQKGERNRK